MSMVSYTVNGFGFSVVDLTVQKTVEFIKKHKESFCNSEENKELFSEIENLNDKEELEDIFSSYCCERSAREGYAAAVSNIIYAETGIEVQYEPGQGDCVGEACIILSEAMPWYYTDKEKELTRDKLIDILSPYVDELGLSDVPIEQQSVEYFG